MKSPTRPDRQGAQRELLERGVYKARWLIDGCAALYAVTSAHNRLPGIIVLRDGISERVARHRLRKRLDAADPPPYEGGGLCRVLRLVPPDEN